MKIVCMKYQYRRDFTADFKCEACGIICEDVKGYDDRNFHDNVIPDMHCPVCGKSRNDLGIKGDYTETRYPDGYQI